ncbi:MAG: hypothetical protein ACI4TK_13940, partial [Agathobacter sp.]
VNFPICCAHLLFAGKATCRTHALISHKHDEHNCDYLPLLQSMLLRLQCGRDGGSNDDTSSH